MSSTYDTKDPDFGISLAKDCGYKCDLNLFADLNTLGNRYDCPEYSGKEMPVYLNNSMCGIICPCIGFCQNRAAFEEVMQLYNASPSGKYGYYLRFYQNGIYVQFGGCS